MHIIFCFRYDSEFRPHVLYMFINVSLYLCLLCGYKCTVLWFSFKLKKGAILSMDQCIHVGVIH